MDNGALLKLSIGLQGNDPHRVKRLRTHNTVKRTQTWTSWVGAGSECWNEMWHWLRWNADPVATVKVLRDLTRALIYQCRRAIPEKIGKSKNWNSVFFRQRGALSTSFDIFVVTYRGTNFLPKLVNMLLFSMGKNWISIFGFPLFSGYALSKPPAWASKLDMACVVKILSWKRADIGKVQLQRQGRHLCDVVSVWCEKLNSVSLESHHQCFYTPAAMLQRTNKCQVFKIIFTLFRFHLRRTRIKSFCFLVFRLFTHQWRYETNKCAFHTKHSRSRSTRQAASGDNIYSTNDNFRNR